MGERRATRITAAEMSPPVLLNTRCVSVWYAACRKCTAVCARSLWPAAYCLSTCICMTFAHTHTHTHTDTHTTHRQTQNTEHRTYMHVQHAAPLHIIIHTGNTKYIYDISYMNTYSRI